MKNHLIQRIFLSICLLGLFITLNAVPKIDNSGNEAPTSIFDRLSSRDVLELSVRTDIDRLLTNKKESKYQGAYIKLADAADSTKEWRVELKARGKYRNRICDFPPIKVKFDHSVLGPENLKSFKTLKVVTHCGDQAEAEELLMKEYLAYKMYREITDESFRVQIVKINWLDSSGKHEIGEKWGFIIENEDELAQRIGGTAYDEYGVTQNDLNPQSAAVHSLFQYMIGNSDWDLTKKRNIKLIKSNTSRDITIVPYDFDFSGVCNASYAVTEYDLYSVQERIYLGESSEEEIKEAIKLFKSKKKDIIEVINSFDHISKSGRSEVKKYIRSFFSSLHEPLKDVEYYEQRLLSQREASENASRS